MSKKNEKTQIQNIKSSLAQIVKKVIQNQHVRHQQYNQSSSDVQIQQVDQSELHPSISYTPFQNDFIFLQKIGNTFQQGQGSQSVVQKVMNIQTQQIFAVSIFRTAQSQMVCTIKSTFLNAIKLNSPYIVKTLKLYIDYIQQKIYLLQQFIHYPNLMFYRRNNKIYNFTQNRIQKLVEKILLAVKYMHHKKICHRDLKPSNIMYCWQTQQLKIIDLGISKSFQQSSMCTVTGTLIYKAPEMFIGGFYNQKVDIWALGIIIYELASGEYPFYKEYASETIQCILNDEVSFVNEKFINYSFQMSYFIEKLLSKDPKNRPSAFRCLKNIWLNFEKDQKVILSLIYIKSDSEQASKNRKWSQIIVYKEGNQYQ